jgi:two-component system nitrate/nitrite response regulator NarL
VRVLLGDRDSLFRDAMADALSSRPDIEVVATARDADELVLEAKRAQPDVAVLGWRLPGQNGTAIPPLVQESAPGCPVLILDEAEDVGVLVEALESGASGYLTKKAPLPDVLEATRAVARGEMVIEPSLVGKLVALLLRRRQDQETALLRLSRLTQREHAVLSLLADGADSDSIARALVISPRTATTHLQNIMRKLEVHSRLEAATFISRFGVHREKLSTRWMGAGQASSESLEAVVEDGSRPPSFVIRRERQSL